jgi:hypothetical protein
METLKCFTAYRGIEHLGCGEFLLSKLHPKRVLVYGERRSVSETRAMWVPTLAYGFVSSSFRNSAFRVVRPKALVHGSKANDLFHRREACLPNNPPILTSFHKGSNDFLLRRDVSSSAVVSIHILFVSVCAHSCREASQYDKLHYGLIRGLLIHTGVAGSLAGRRSTFMNCICGSSKSHMQSPSPNMEKRK